MKDSNHYKIAVSIIVTVYNTERFLLKCLKSIYSQVLKEVEIIVVDDASPGNCTEIIQKQIRKNKDIIYIKLDKNVGLYNARRIGVENSCGEYIGFVDSDDFIDKWMFQELYQTAKSRKSEIAECGYFEVFKRIKNEKKSSKLFLEDVQIFYSLYRIPNYEKNVSHHIWNKIFHRGLWNRVSDKFPAMSSSNDGGEDLIRVSILFYYAKSYVGINHSFYYYNRNSEKSASQSTSNEKIIRYITGLNTCIYFIRELIRDDDIALDDLVKNKLWFDLLDLYLRICLVPNDRRKKLLDLYIESFYPWIHLILIPQAIRDKVTVKDNDLKNFISEALESFADNNEFDFLENTVFFQRIIMIREKSSILNNSSRLKVLDRFLKLSKVLLSKVYFIYQSFKKTRISD